MYKKIMLSIILLALTSLASLACNFSSSMPLAVDTNDIIVSGKVVDIEYLSSYESGKLYSATIEIYNILKTDTNYLTSDAKTAIINFMRPKLLCACGVPDIRMELNDEKIFFIYVKDSGELYIRNEHNYTIIGMDNYDYIYNVINYNKYIICLDDIVPANEVI